MNSAIRGLVEVAATKSRYWAEGRASEDDLLGWCAIASAHLYTALVEQGIKPEIHVWEQDGSAHVFLVVEDHVVDITATQFYEFEDVPVLIIHSREAQAYMYYDSKHVFKNVSDLRKYQRRSRWATSQVAYA